MLGTLNNDAVCGPLNRKLQFAVFFQYYHKITLASLDGMYRLCIDDENVFRPEVMISSIVLDG
jgi:hypothetical protein